jgi:hypothetical protein
VRFVYSMVVILNCCFYLPVDARPACAQTATLRINELMAGPARDWNGDGVYSSRDDEWVEIVNTGSGSVDLAAFFVMDGDSSPRCGLTGMLAPGARRVVTGKEAYDWERATGHPAFGLSLGNSGDRVTLWQVSGAETLYVDGVTYASAQAASDRSLGRFPDGGDGWVVWDQLNPYTGTTPPLGNGCAPTPALPNACDTTPVRRATWGEVKAIYR